MQNKVALDVAILGGGLAGNLIARQLRRTLPHLSVGVFEKNRATSYKVGESTVEIASNYFIRRLGLSAYLYDQQLPKNGLRFFFDTEKKDQDLMDMSEIGSTAFPFHPGFQIDRARLEADLQRMNQEDGVQVEVGAKVKELSLADTNGTGEGHTFEVESESGRKSCRCRWVVDASGRSSLIARQLGLRQAEHNHGLAAVWGRFAKVADLDTFGPEEFRSRVRHTSRVLSTTTLCYPGYWIWFIPLGRGLTSVGLVTERSAVWHEDLRKEQRFLEFLREHRAAESLLPDATLIDIGSYSQLAYNTQQFFDGNRWALTGEAAAFTDPFYSPGSDFIALENDFITDLIRRDDAGETKTQLHARSELYNRYMLFRHEASMLLYRNLYSTIGSYGLFQVKWYLDFALYYHLWVSQYMQDCHLDETFLKRQLEESQGVLTALSNFSDLLRHVEQRLKDRGDYFRMNSGEFIEGVAGIDFVREVGLPQRRFRMLKRLSEILNVARRRLLELLAEEGAPITYEPIPLSQFLEPRPLW